MNIKASLPPAAKDVAAVQPRLWVSKYADYLYAFALLRTDCDETARDLVQDTFLAGLEKLNSFEKKSSEKTWLTGILKHKIFDLYRTRSECVLGKEKTWDHFFRNEDGHWLTDKVPTYIGLGRQHPIETKEYLEILQICIKKLPQTWLAVFTMKHMEEYSTAFICEQLKITQANFWVIIHRAKVSIRACLEKHA